MSEIYKYEIYIESNIFYSHIQAKENLERLLTKIVKEIESEELITAKIVKVK